jgi:OOP family OmpA-OmpF porin
MPLRIEPQSASNIVVALHNDKSVCRYQAGVGTTLVEISKLAVIVVGHTDNKGTFDYNLELSARRSQAVRDSLISRFKFASERLTAASAGMMAPVASNDTDEGRAKNHRVVLVKMN